MATATGTTKHLTLKLLIDKKKDVVLFAEAGKDVVDFIFHLLALPMGTVVRLVTKTAMGGSLRNIYDSVETLDNTYWQSSCNNKDIPLKPKTPNYGGGSFETLLLPSANNNATADFTQTYYRCARVLTSLLYEYHSGSPYTCRNYVTQSASAKCPSCGFLMNHALTLVKHEAPRPVVQSNSSGGGYVKGVVTYMVMDNLEVKPMSTISSITLLNKCKVMNLSAVEEKVVDFGFEEGVKLLKASMESTNVLTHVFLRGKKKRAAAH